VTIGCSLRYGNADAVFPPFLTKRVETVRFLPSGSKLWEAGGLPLSTRAGCELWRNGKLERLSAKKEKGHKEEFAAFLSACRSGGPAPIHGTNFTESRGRH